jgi:predicted glycosyltransferase
LLADSSGIVAMGGYNTFCEILSFDKPSLIVPRTVPRLEQYIRASRAEDLGLGRMILDDGIRDPRQMAAALKDLPFQSKPSETHIPGVLDGLSTINGVIDRLLGQRSVKRARLSLVEPGT